MTVEDLDADLERSPFAGAPDPEFEILRAAPVERAAAPTVSFTVRAADDSGRRLFTVAITAVITIEPSKRRYDDETRERLFELFGEPQRWSSTTTNFRWAQADALVPAFEGSTEFELVVPCTYDLELAASKYFDGLADGEAPLRFHFNGTVFYESDDGRMQIVQIPWDRSPRFQMPVAVWRGAIDAVYPYRAWVPVDRRTLAALQRRKVERGLPTFDAVVDELLAERRGGLRVREQLERLVSSLLYEGYALYPYTPGATKNATPTPFGIVYPPAYAEGMPTTFDHLRLECVLAAGPEAEVRATVRFLQASGERHRAVERRLHLGPASLDTLGDGVGEPFEFDGTRTVRGRARLRCEPLDEPGLWRIRACVHNTTEVEPGLERNEALLGSLLSTHVVVETGAGRFVSPLEREGPAGAAVEACRNVNTFPVLAAPADDAILAAAIVLPDHPRLAPESLGNLFDNTEIEEALLLHVQALSDDERAAIADQDPAVREMIERAERATPDQLLALHGRLETADPPAVPQWTEPGAPPDPGPPPEPGHPNPGEAELELDGVVFRKGAKVILRPGTDRDVIDRMLDGRTATIERLYLDYEDGAHIAVTVDDDPGQELFRETGRYLFFRAGELEAV